MILGTTSSDSSSHSMILCRSVVATVVVLERNLVLLELTSDSCLRNCWRLLTLHSSNSLVADLMLSVLTSESCLQKFWRLLTLPPSDLLSLSLRRPVFLTALCNATSILWHSNSCQRLEAVDASYVDLTSIILICWSTAHSLLTFAFRYNCSTISTNPIWIMFQYQFVIQGVALHFHGRRRFLLNT